MLLEKQKHLHLQKYAFFCSCECRTNSSMTPHVFLTFLNLTLTMFKHPGDVKFTQHLKCKVFSTQQSLKGTSQRCSQVSRGAAQREGERGKSHPVSIHFYSPFKSLSFPLRLSWSRVSGALCDCNQERFYISGVLQKKCPYGGPDILHIKCPQQKCDLSSLICHILKHANCFTWTTVSLAARFLFSYMRIKRRDRTAWSDGDKYGRIIGRIYFTYQKEKYSLCRMLPLIVLNYYLI